MKGQDKEIAQLKKEVYELKQQIKSFMDFVGYAGKPYKTIVKADNVTIINHA